MMAIWRHLPLPLGAVLWIPQVSHFMLLPLFFTFHAAMPRLLFRQAWKWFLVWTPPVLVSAWGIIKLFRSVYYPPHFTTVPEWLLFVVGLIILVYGLGGLAALILNFILLTDPSARRRMRVMVVGSLIGWFPSMLFLPSIFWGPLTSSPVVWFFVSTPYRLFSLSLFTIVPLSLTYAIVRHGVFELTATQSLAGDEELRVEGSHRALLRD